MSTSTTTPTRNPKNKLNNADTSNNPTAASSPSSPLSSSKRVSPSSKSKPERPYALYSNQPIRSYAFRHSSLRQKSFNLQKMSHSISQNLINMQYGRPSSAGSYNPLSPSSAGSSHTQTQPRQLPLPTLPQAKTQPILQNLNTFLTHHLSYHRPVALVTSGGTITTLEQNTIRYLDNFSTGQRGAISVEEFCKRGYAVIHLWRRGSTAPYSRVLSKLLGCKQGNHALDFEALGFLFEGQGQGQADGRMGRETSTSFDSDVETNINLRSKQVVSKDTHRNGGKGYHDPWLSTTKRSKSNHDTSSTFTSMTNQEEYNNSTNNTIDSQKYSSQNRMKLTSHILNNNLLQRKLRERSDVITNNLLFTIPFTTVEEYIALLKLTTEAMDQCQSLGLIYLAAAVSDFYIPDDDKVVHKIQSRDYGIKNYDSNGDAVDDNQASAITMNPVNNTLSLTLQPVPKVITHVRKKWAPHSFCVSFKLETDEKILKQKVETAIEKYDVHLVIGNVLDTRHSTVSLFQRKSEYDSGNKGLELECTEVTKSNPNGGDEDDDDLEDNVISNVVEKHFDYIANHYLIDKSSDICEIDDDDDDLESVSGDKSSVVPHTALMTGAEAAARHNAIMRKKKEVLQKELYWKHVRDVTLNIAGHALGCYLSFVISSALQNSMQ